MHPSLLRCRLVAIAIFACICLPSDSVAAEQADGKPAVDTVLICPRVFRSALDAWFQLRFQQGHGLALIEHPGHPTAEQLQTRVRELAKTEPGLKFVVLVGDVAPPDSNDPQVLDRTVPTFHTPAKVIKLLGRDTDIVGDNRYGDLDGDGVPELAVGRLSVQTPEQLTTVVAKILAHERLAFGGPTRRQIHFVAGLGGFGALADKVLEMCAQRFICDGVPIEYNTSMTYASWSSPYCPPMETFCDTAFSRMNEGSLFWVYIGHGNTTGLDWLRLPDNRFPSILTCADASRLKCPQGAPVALFLACYTGAFDQAEPCLAEELLQSSGGPVAVFSGSRVTMPYAMTVLGQELLKECFVNRRETIGEIMLHANCAMVQGQRTGPTAVLLDSLAATLGFHDDLDAERREHLELFNLLGDPLLRVPRPDDMQLLAPATAEQGATIEVSGTCQLDGTCTVDIVVPRDQLTFDPPRKAAPTGSAEQRLLYGTTYLKANDRRLASVQAKCQSGRFTARIALPSGFAGKCHVVSYLQGQGEAALGACDLEVLPAKTP